MLLIFFHTNQYFPTCRTRQGYLEDFHLFYQLVQDLEEEGQWVAEKLTICAATIQAKGQIMKNLFPFQKFISSIFFLLFQSIKLFFLSVLDLRALTALQQKHNSLCDEMVWRQNRFKGGALASAEEIIAGGHPKADYLAEQCEKIRQKWTALTAEAEKRRFHLEAGTEAYQFFSDCNETDSVIKVGSLKIPCENFCSGVKIFANMGNS